MANFCCNFLFLSLSSTQTGTHLTVTINCLSLSLCDTHTHTHAHTHTPHLISPPSPSHTHASPQFTHTFSSEHNDGGLAHACLRVRGPIVGSSPCSRWQQADVARRGGLSVRSGLTTVFGLPGTEVVPVAHRTRRHALPGAAGLRSVSATVTGLGPGRFKLVVSPRIRVRPNVPGDGVVRVTRGRSVTVSHEVQAP